MGMEWRQRRPGEWWQMFTDAPEPLGEEVNGTRWPPSMVVSWGGRGCCVHLHSYSNGAMPGDEGREDDVDYLHICDLDDFIEELQALRAAMRWQRPEWDER